jgi:hypothetical protein
MLPFMPDKKAGSVSQATLEDGKIKDDEPIDPGLEEAASSMMKAKDSKAYAQALCEFLDIYAMSDMREDEGME